MSKTARFVAAALFLGALCYLVGVGIATLLIGDPCIVPAPSVVPKQDVERLGAIARSRLAALQAVKASS